MWHKTLSLSLTLPVFTPYRYYEWQTKEGNKQPYYIYPPTGSQDKVKAEVKAEADEKVKVEADEKAMVKDEDNGSIAKEEKKVKSEKQGRWMWNANIICLRVMTPIFNRGQHSTCIYFTEFS